MNPVLPEALPASESDWPFERVPARLLEELGMPVRELRPLRWKREQLTPLYYLETDEGRYVLKLSTPRNERSSWLGDYLERLEIGHQARVLSALGKREYPTLRFPRLAASDGGSYMLLEYIDTRPHGEHDLPREELLRSLLEFQLSDVPVRSPLVAVLGRSPAVLMTRLLLGSLRSRLGWRSALRGLSVMAACYRGQPRLGRRVLRHNDFHHNNILLGSDGALYLSDFEYVARDDRWVLGDVVYYAVGTRFFAIDTRLVIDYARLLERESGLDVRLAPQLRFNLLFRVGRLIVSSAPPPDVAERYRLFFEEVLLDDDRFGAWLEEACREDRAERDLAQVS